MHTGNIHWLALFFILPILRLWIKQREHPLEFHCRWKSKIFNSVNLATAQQICNLKLSCVLCLCHDNNGIQWLSRRRKSRNSHRRKHWARNISHNTHGWKTIKTEGIPHRSNGKTRRTLWVYHKPHQTSIKRIKVMTPQNRLAESYSWKTHFKPYIWNVKNIGQNRTNVGQL